MDANGTRFHLLLGEADWARCRTSGGRAAFDPAAREVQWNARRHEVTLWQREFRFLGARGQRRLAPEDRRGAARDRFGNWYWIAPDRASVLVRSSGGGSQTVSTFWPPEPVDGEACGSDDGGFRECPPVVPPAPTVLQGLAVTEDHYLVIGTVRPTAGLLMFDLYAGGASRQRVWPAAAPFEPFDLAPRVGGGVWILDRVHRRVWELDRRFEVVTSDAGAPSPDAGDFVSVGGDAPAGMIARPNVRSEQGWPVPAADPVAVEPLPAGGVLVLDRADDATGGGDEAGFARVHWLVAGAPRGAPASTASLAARIEPVPDAPPFTLAGHDFALGTVATDESTNDPPSLRLHVVGAEGDQAFAFDVSTTNGRLALTPVTEYFPMRLFGGRALVAVDGQPWYDSGDVFVRLLRQSRPRHVEAGELWTPILDGRDPACVWHRLMLDACIPPGTSVDVYSRASDDWRELTLVDWLAPAERRALGAPAEDELVEPEPGDPLVAEDLAAWQPEPAPYLRGDGPELPYLPRETGDGRGTWELLFQHARGRYLQVRLVLRGDGRGTPRLRALRAWFPRFSYLERYLPAVYRDDATSASFLDRFLANVEGTFTAIEDRIAAAQILFDVASAPPDTLDWLARWFGIALDPSWEDERRRLLIAHAMDFFAVRGTPRGLQLALRLALDECVDERLFEPASTADGVARRASPVRIVERYRTRRTPPALVGDVTTAVPGPRPLDATARWEPSLGGAELHRRYRAALGLGSGAELPLVADGATPTDAWTAFAERTLGFVPRTAAAERGRWAAFLQRRGLPAGARLPAAEPGPGAPGDGSADVSAPEWKRFLDETPNRRRREWQDFLARRYRTADALSAAWKASWTSLRLIPLPDRLPPDGPALADWVQFEGAVLDMHRTAHRFTVMLPVPPHLPTDTPAQQRRVALARAVLDLEKPAHTVYDLRFYWAMFRLGEARLGDDTVVDLGSRSPALMAPMVLGQGYLAEAFLAARPGADAPERLQIGRDRVGRSTRLGGP